MSEYDDVMIDLETTGTSPEETAIIQISAVRFNLKERTVDSKDMFDRCLWVAPKRYWDEDTRSWWMGKNRQTFAQISARMEDPFVVFPAFIDWATAKYQGDKPLTFWSKPSHFDFAFIESYCKQFQRMNPFHFRQATDLNSYIRGLGKSVEAPLNYREFEGVAHNAIIDVLNQIGNLFAAQDHYESQNS